MTFNSNMGGTVPTVLVTTGSLYASQINADLDLIGDHDHSTGKGVKVTPSGLNINSSLAFNNNDARSLRSTAYTSQIVTLNNPTDLNAAYVVNGDLYFNNNVGFPIQVTSGSIVNSAAAVLANAWSLKNASVSLIIVPSDVFSYIEVNTNSSMAMSLPAVSSMTAGRFYFIHDVTGLSETNNISVTPNGTDTINNSGGVQTLAFNKGTWLFTANGATNWDVNFIPNNSTFASGSLYLGAHPATTGTIAFSSQGSAFVRNTAGSANIGLFTHNSDNSVTFGDITNLSQLKLNSSTNLTVSSSAASFVASTGTLQMSAGNKIQLSASNDLFVSSSAASFVASTGTLQMSAGDKIQLSASNDLLLSSSASTKLYGATQLNITSSNVQISSTGWRVDNKTVNFTPSTFDVTPTSTFTVTAGTIVTVSSILTILTGSSIVLGGRTYVPQRTVIANWTFDSGVNKDNIIFVNTSTGLSGTLPDPTAEAGRVIKIKDIKGSASLNPITLVRNGSEKIEGVASNYTLAADWGSWDISSDGIGWFVVGRG